MIKLNFLVDQDNVYENLDDLDLSTSRQTFSTLTLRKNKGKYLSSWTIDDRFSLKICAISRLNTDVNRTVEVRNILNNFTFNALLSFI